MKVFVSTSLSHESPNLNVLTVSVFVNETEVARCPGRCGSVDKTKRWPVGSLGGARPQILSAVPSWDVNRRQRMVPLTQQGESHL